MAERQGPTTGKRQIRLSQDRWLAEAYGVQMALKRAGPMAPGRNPDGPGLDRAPRATARRYRWSPWAARKPATRQPPGPIRPGYGDLWSAFKLLLLRVRVRWRRSAAPLSR